MKMRMSKNIIRSVLAVGIFLSLPNRVFAIPADYQQCLVNQTCTIGEFLFDDTYTPIATAACSITSRYPDGDVFINSQSMTAAADGWYSYDVQATGSAGFYRSQVCCTSDGEYMCLDKSFKVVTASSSSSLSSSDIASAVWDASRSAHTTVGTFGEIMQNIIPSADAIADAVWGHSSRTLSGFGTLVSDIWSSSSRSLTSFTAVASDVWSYATRTLTGKDISGGSLATKSDIDEVKSEIDALGVSTTGLSTSESTRLATIERLSQENRLLLEQLVKKPIIQNFLEEDSSPDLSVKLKETDIVARQVYVGVNSVGGKMGLIPLRWEKMSSKDVLTVLNELSKLMGDDTSHTKSTVLGGLTALRGAWDMALLEDMEQETQAFIVRLESLQAEIRTHGKSTAAFDDISQLRLNLTSIENMLGSEKDMSTKDTFFARIQTIHRLSTSLDKNTVKIDKLLAKWNSYKPEEIKSKTILMADAVSAVNAIPQAMVHLTIDESKKQTNKQLKNKVLGMRAVLDANRLLLARNSEKPLTNTWLEEGSIIFKSLVTNPSKLISQTVPLKYYLPKEVTKESIVSVDEGLVVEYDSEKDQLYVEGEFVLTPEASKTISITVDESVFTVPTSTIATLRTQAEELSKPLKNTAYFAQGVTLQSDINVSLDKIASLQKYSSTPEARIKAYRESQIEINAVKIKMEKLKELVTQASSASSLVGFIGGAQAVGVWGLIIIIVAGFGILILYMRVLRPIALKNHDGHEVHADRHEDNEEEADSHKAHSKVISKSKGIGKLVQLALIIIVCTVSTSAISGFAVYKIMAGSLPKQDSIALNEKISPEPDKEEAVMGATSESSSSAELEEDAQMSSEISVTILETGTGFLRVRSEPDGKEIGRVTPGTQHEVLSQKAAWWEISLEDGTSGWITKKFATVSNSPDL